MRRTLFFLFISLFLFWGCEKEGALSNNALQFTKNKEPWNVNIQILPTEEKDSCRNCVDILFSEKKELPDSLTVFNVPLIEGKYTLKTWESNAQQDTCIVKFSSYNKDYSMFGYNFEITSISEKKDTVEGKFYITFHHESRKDTIAINLSLIHI